MTWALRMKIFCSMTLVAKTVFLIRQFFINKYSGFIPLYLFLCLLALLSACEFKPETSRYSGSIMGTYYKLSFVADKDQINDSGVVHQMALSIMQQVNQQMSTYLENSELSLLNKSSSVAWQPVSKQLFDVLFAASTIADLTDGAFDITVAPIVNEWGFGPEIKQARVLTANEINHFSNFIGIDKFSLDANNGVRKHHANVGFDLSAIAKGYAVDQVAEYLLAQNIQNFLIDIGGELRAKGVNEDNKPWQVAIEKPNILGGLQQIIALRDAAIATSGDYRNFVEIDGSKYSHAFDPRELKPVQHKLASASVIAKDAMLADALATSLMVMGEKQAYDFAIANNLAAYLIIRDENQYKIRFTEQFKPYLQL